MDDGMSRLAGVTVANDDIDPFEHGPFGDGWQSADLDLTGIDIAQLTSTDVIKMMMGGRVRIVEDLGWICDHLPYQAFLREQPEGVVHSGFRHVSIPLIYCSVDIISGHMGAMRQQHLHDPDPLTGRIDAVAPQ